MQLRSIEGNLLEDVFGNVCLEFSHIANRPITIEKKYRARYATAMLDQTRQSDPRATMLATSPPGYLDCPPPAKCNIAFYFVDRLCTTRTSRAATAAASSATAAPATTTTSATTTIAVSSMVTTAATLWLVCLLLLHDLNNLFWDTEVFNLSMRLVVSQYRILCIDDRVALTYVVAPNIDLG